MKVSSILVGITLLSSSVLGLPNQLHRRQDEVSPTDNTESEAGTASLPPSPTESTGCEPHGDHWHCEGPVESDSLSSASLPPSPTASTGCEPHGDHWHCEGPVESDSLSETASLPPSPTASTGCEPHGDHWHCEGPVEGESAEEESEEGEDSAGSIFVPVGQFVAFSTAIVAGFFVV